MAWDKSTAYDPNASDDELICSARRQRYEPARRGRRRV